MSHLSELRKISEDFYETNDEQLNPILRFYHLFIIFFQNNKEKETFRSFFSIKKRSSAHHREEVGCCGEYLTYGNCCAEENARLRRREKKELRKVFVRVLVVEALETHSLQILAQLNVVERVKCHNCIHRRCIYSGTRSYVFLCFRLEVKS